jgi:hypothetical protein
MKAQPRDPRPELTEVPDVPDYLQSLGSANEGECWQLQSIKTPHRCL